MAAPSRRRAQLGWLTQLAAVAAVAAGFGFLTTGHAVPPPPVPTVTTQLLPVSGDSGSGGAGPSYSFARAPHVRHVRCGLFRC